MPLCFCVSSGCSTAGGTDPISHEPLGRKVDGRTFKAHSNADRKAALHAAEQNTEATVDAQIEEITTYLVASVLADEVSGPSQSLAVRFGQDPTVLRITHLKASPLLHPEWHTLRHHFLTRRQVTAIRTCTIKIPVPHLYTLLLIKLAQGAHARLRFSRVWGTSR